MAEKKLTPDKEKLHGMMYGVHGATDPFELDVNDKESVRQLVEMGEQAKIVLSQMW